MRWTTWTLFGLALVVCVGLIAMVQRQAQKTPDVFFASVVEQIEAGHYDDELALANLDLALDRARTAEDPALVSAVLLARGKLLTRIGSWDRARADLETVYEERGGPRDIDLLLADLEARSGDVRKALVRVEGQLARDPSDAAGWQRAGKLHEQAAQKALERALASVAHELVPEDAARGRELATRLASLDPTDPARYSLAHRLRALYSPARGEETELLLRVCDEAARDAQGARESYTRALQLAVEPESVRGLMQLLDQAGRPEEAATLLTAAWRVPELRADLGVTSQSLRTLETLGRRRFGSDITLQWLNRQLPAPPSFYLETSRALFAAAQADPKNPRLWPALDTSARKLYDVDVAEASTVFFFLGMSHMRQADRFKDLYEMAQLELGAKFLNASGNVSEPVPGARAIAHRELAHAARVLGQAQAEREQLTGALALEPDFDGALWLRLAELQVASPNASYRDPETRYAKGMRLLPARVAELMPRWKELGELELRAAGIDPETLRTEDQQKRIWTPPGDASPYELFRLAQVHLEHGDAPRARVYARKLLSDLPGFLPALDLAIEVARRENTTRELVELCVQRLAVHRADENLIELLQGLPNDAIEPAQRVELMRGDPERFGRVTVARALAQRGETLRARKLLDAAGLEQLSRGARVFAARLAYELEDPKRALDVLDGLGAGDAAGPRRPDEIELYVRAGVRAGDSVRLVAGLERLTAEAPADARPWYALADQLMLANMPSVARTLLDRLDLEEHLRGPEVLRRLQLCAITERDTAAASLYGARAQAFETNGGYEFGRLLAAIDAEHWEDVAADAGALAESRWRATPLQRAILALLAEQPAEAADAVAIAGENAPPAWALVDAACAALAGRTWQAPAELGPTCTAETELFLRGAEKEADARQALAIALASTTPLGQGWARARLEDLPRKTRGALWRNWLLAVLAREQGDSRAERELLHALVGRHPGFVPAWDAYERMLGGPNTDPAVAAALRERRAQALGGTRAGPAELAIAEAQNLAARGDLPAALAAARRAVEFPQRQGRARREYALRLEDTGDFRAAIVEGKKALDVLLARADSEFLGRHLALLDRNADTEPPALADGELREHLATLKARFPRDPRVVLTLARQDLASEPRNPSIGVARALARLDAFRSRHAQKSLEELARGSLARWLEFYLEIDPEHAQELALAERLLDPGNVETWIWCARARAARGDLDAALAELRVVDRLVPNAGVPREILRLSVRRELSTEALAQLLTDVRTSESLAENDAELKLLRAEAVWCNGPRSAPNVIEILGPLESAFPAGSALAVRRGLLFGAALCVRALDADPNTQAQGDRERAQSVLAVVLAQLEDPYRAHLARALQGIANVPLSATAAPAAAPGG